MQESLPPQEKVLLDYVERLDKHRKGRRAVHVHLSRLRPHNRRTHHMRIAASTFEPLIRTFDGALFRLCNDDLVVVCRGASVSDIDEAVLRLRYLFSEDPMLAGNEENGGEFCTWFNVEKDYKSLLTLAQDAVERRDRYEAQRKQEANKKSQRANEHAPGKTLEPWQLAGIEKSIAQADLSSLLRRQPVCAVAEGQRPQPVFSELFISIRELREVVLPDVDILSDRWLFQHLTERLDRRMLALLERHEDPTLRQAFSLNLNVSTLLSPEFLNFDKALHSASRRTIVIELQLIDVLSDVGNFLFARDFLQERGYRLCLDSMTHLALPYVDRKQLGFDLVKLQWRADLADQLYGEGGGRLNDLVQHCQPDRIILCRCDTEQAHDVGRALGVSLYQGYYFDRLIAQHNQRGRGRAAAALGVRAARAGTG